jgi:hypothetical protein
MHDQDAGRSANRHCFVIVATTCLLGIGAELPGEELEALRMATHEIQEEELLDIGIRILDPGLPGDEQERLKLEDIGVYADVRKSESRYIPIRLKETLAATGYWGAVRLVPDATIVDVLVDGTIRESTGKKLEVEMTVIDARGRRWFKKSFEEEADALAYSSRRRERRPFQNLYHRIANKMLEERRDLEARDLSRIREIAELQFARDLAPAAFGDYLRLDKGRYRIEKLPADSDPMMDRVTRIRDRDYMFIDTLNGYYDDFFARMQVPYDDWRAFSYEEQLALDQLKRAARWEKILGAAAIIGGVMAQRSGNRGAREGGEVAIIGGAAAISDGMKKGEEAKMHQEGLRELAESLDSEVAPLLLDVEGEVVRLNGTVEAQYAQWRRMLRRLFAEETGLPIDPNEPLDEKRQRERDRDLNRDGR